MIRRRTTSAEDLCKTLEQNPTDRLQTTTLDTCFEISYRYLSPPEQAALLGLVVWGHSISRETFEQVFERPVAILEELEALALLTCQSGAFLMHDTVRDFLNLKTDEQMRLRFRQRILARHYWPVLDRLEHLVRQGTAKTFKEATALFWASTNGLQLFVEWLVTVACCAIST